MPKVAVPVVKGSLNLAPHHLNVPHVEKPILADAANVEIRALFMFARNAGSRGLRLDKLIGSDHPWARLL